MITNMISQIILKELSWDTHTSKMKISMAAFFHDILIIEYDENIEKLESMTSYDIENLKESNLNFFNHSLKTAELFDKMKNMPADVVQIISSHHELPNGKGFPKVLLGARKLH
jgi:response regulator RpfG family c-di-GMP phosphodiesterase